MPTRILLAALLLLAPVSLFGQGAGESALTEAEVEALRDSAYVANDRILTFVKFLDARSSEIQSLATKPRRPGREEDLHTLYEQFTSIADELDDNLDDLGPRHRDMRKALPKLLAATERWATALKTPADNEAYNVSRKLALEAVRDLREASTQLIEEQKTWFLAHPPAKDAPVNENGAASPLMLKFLRQLLFGEPATPVSRVSHGLEAPARPLPENPQRGRVKLTQAVPNALVQIFEEQYRELRPRAPIPPLDIRFRRFTSLNTTIRLREGHLHVRLSDLLEHAPETVHRAIAHILLAKLYKKPIAAAHADRYRRHVSSEAVAKQAEHIRQTRGRKRITAPEGHHYDLNEVFESLNHRFFHGLLGRPTLTWSAHHARRMLGHYDAAHNTIVVSRVFDRPDTPRCAIEYLLYHEMLHLKHPVRVKAGRRCVHSKAFQAEERLFPELEEAKAYLKML